LLYQLAGQAPGAPIWLDLGAERLLILQDAPSAAHLLRTNPDNYHKNFALFTALFGTSRLTSDGDRWRKLLKLSQPFLTAREPEDIAAAARTYFGLAVDQLVAASSKSEVVVIDRMLDRAAAGVVLEVAFGLTGPLFSDSLWDDLRTLLNFCGQASWNVRGTQVSQDPMVTAEAKRALARWRSHCLTLLARPGPSGGPESALLEAMANAPTDDVDSLAEFTTLLFAGFDTSASALGWSLWLLAGLPRLQERLRAEVRSVLANAPPDAAKAEQVPNLLAFLNEALRIFPPVPLLSRIAVSNDRFEGHEIGPGQKILLSIIGLHHDRNVWTDPGSVQLARFAGGAPTRDQRPHLLPFSDGPRRCGGMRFAMTELSVALMLILDRIRVKRPERDPVQFLWGASLRRQGGQRLAIERA
jgi:cytochrome P450